MNTIMEVVPCDKGDIDLKSKKGFYVCAMKFMALIATILQVTQAGTLISSS